jgi:hypothetical protein
MHVLKPKKVTSVSFNRQHSYSKIGCLWRVSTGPWRRKKDRSGQPDRRIATAEWGCGGEAIQQPHYSLVSCFMPVRKIEIQRFRLSKNFEKLDIAGDNAGEQALA